RVEAIQSALAGRFDEEALQIVESSPTSLGRLASLLDVPEGYEAAVSAALGPWADAVAFPDRSALREVAGQVKSRGSGSVALVTGRSGVTVTARDVARFKGLDALIDLL